jgi:GNAT superfamily N-acetyltransferase
MKTRIEKLSSRPNEEAVFVACLQQQIVGWIHLSVQRPLQSEIHVLIGGLVVTEDCRNAGVGARLVHHAEQWAKLQGICKMRVSSRSTREAAHRFYLRHDYLPLKASAVFEKDL